MANWYRVNNLNCQLFRTSRAKTYACARPLKRRILIRGETKSQITRNGAHTANFLSGFSAAASMATGSGKRRWGWCMTRRGAPGTGTEGLQGPGSGLDLTLRFTPVSSPLLISSARALQATPSSYITPVKMTATTML